MTKPNDSSPHIPLPRGQKLLIPWYPELFEGNGKGVLPHCVASQACWYYYTLAQQHYERKGKSIDDQIIIEDTHSSGPPPLWLDRSTYLPLKRSVAALYHVSFEEMDRHWDKVGVTASMLRLPWPNDEYTILRNVIQP